MSNNTQTLEGAFLIYKSQSQHWETQSFTISCQDSWSLKQAVHSMSLKIREDEWTDDDMADEDFMVVGVGYPDGSCADGQWIQVGYNPVGAELIRSIVNENRLPLEDLPQYANHVLSMIG